MNSVVLFTEISKYPYAKLIRETLMHNNVLAFSLPINSPLDTIERNLTLWIQLIATWIEKALIPIENPITNLYVIEYTISFIRIIFDNIFLYPKECKQLTDALMKAVILSRKLDVNIELKKVKNIWKEL